MSWVAAAGAAVAVVGGVVSKNSADDAADQADEASRRSLAQDQKGYDEWQSTYGSVEDNLSDYYNSLTPELRMTQGLQAFNQERDLAMGKLEDNLAQRGIARSGLAGAIQTESALKSAETRAQIRANAPMEVAKEKLGFLNAGLGNQTNNLSNNLAGRANTAGSIATQAAANSGLATAKAVEAGAGLAGDLANAFATRGEE